MKIISYIIGIIVTLAGIIGFFSAPILGMIETNTIQNIVYIVLGLGVIHGIKKGKTICPKIVGIIFAVLGILGLMMSGDTVIGIIQNTGTGNWFHLIIGIILLAIAFSGKCCSTKKEGYSAPAQPEAPEAPQQPQNPQM